MVDIKKEIVNGTLYSAIGKYSTLVINLIITAVLARLLSPSDFGVVAIATIFISFFSLLSDFGFSSAIIQNKNLSKYNIENIFTFSILLSLVFSLLFFFGARFISSFYVHKELLPILRFLSLCVLFSTLNIVPNSLLLKEKKFKFIAIRALIIQSIIGLIAVIAAYKGFGIYSLLINPILGSFIIFIVNFIYSPILPRFKNLLSSVKLIINFSIYQFLFNFINYFARNIDKLIIGKYFNMGDLGYYEKSYRLMQLPIQNITFVITPVLHPILSKFQDNTKVLFSQYLKIIKPISLIAFPITVFLYLTSEELIILFFGDQWYDSIPIFQILSLSSGIQIILSTSGSIFLSANSPKYLFISGLITTSTTLFAIVLGIFQFKSLIYIASFITITFYINFFIAFYILIKIVLKMKLSDFLIEFVKPLILNIILFSFCSVVYFIFSFETIIFSFCFKFIIFAMFYLILLIVSKEIFYIKTLIKR